MPMYEYECISCNIRYELEQPITSNAAPLCCGTHMRQVYHAPGISFKGTGCNHNERPIGVYGSLNDEIPGGGKTAENIGQAREAMGIDWMLWGELVEAIPPAYTHYIGQQIAGKL